MIYRRIYGFPSMEQRNPFMELERMRRQMDRFFDGLSVGQVRPAAGVFPLINLTETRDALTVRAELPGISSEDIDIQATGNTLSLSGRRSLPEEDRMAKYHRRERESGEFSRLIGLPTDINPDKVEASMKNGVLTIVLPRAEASKPKQINVK
jgi:HSP20 family protein